MWCSFFNGYLSVVVQMNTCLIDGNCYDSGEVNPENPSQLCDPLRSTAGWTGITEFVLLEELWLPLVCP